MGQWSKQQTDTWQNWFDSHLNVYAVAQELIHWLLGVKKLPLELIHVILQFKPTD